MKSVCSPNLLLLGLRSVISLVLVDIHKFCVVQNDAICAISSNTTIAVVFFCLK